tara:strand:- start:1232 stop:2371 length:1140 start_codon:yes stop_codon:yes gene_type:complete
MLITVPLSNYAQRNSYYDKYEFRKKRHEVNFGVGASGCLTDLGGSDMSLNELNQKKTTKYLKSFYDIDLATTRYVVNAAYLYHLTRKLNFRTNLSFSSISADDSQTEEFYRNNRNLNFKSNIIEISAIIEFYITKPNTGNRYGLRNTSGKKLAPSVLGRLGLYLFAGIGGFYFNPKAKNNLNYSNDSFENLNFSPSSEQKYISLRDLHTEGQGMPNDPAGFKSGKTYSDFSMCIPFGFGLEKAFSSNSGLKIEGGFRYTMTDYLDDVSRDYYNRSDLEQQYGNLAATMSGTHSGNTYLYTGYANNGNYPDGAITSTAPPGSQEYKIYKTYTEPLNQRGNPEDNDCYGFITISFYKKLKSKTKAYKKISMYKKRKVKASF